MSICTIPLVDPSIRYRPFICRNWTFVTPTFPIFFLVNCRSISANLYYWPLKVVQAVDQIETWPLQKLNKMQPSNNLPLKHREKKNNYKNIKAFSVSEITYLPNEYAELGIYISKIWYRPLREMGGYVPITAAHRFWKIY